MESILLKFAENAAAAAGLEPALVKAIIEQESDWQPYAWNPEAKFHWLWNVKLGEPFRKVTPVELASKTPPLDFPALRGDRDQEWWAQQASWGLMQLMGACAREVGCKADYLPVLVDPETNLRFGCRLFLRKLHAAGQDVRQALLYWNGGSDLTYPDKVLARRVHYVS